MNEIVYVLAVEGLEKSLSDLGEISPMVERNAARAINRVTQQGRASASRRIREQVDLSASYLGPGQGRLTVSKKAKPGDLEGVIRGRARPTSLAQFTKDRPLAPGQRRQRRGKGIKVTVKPGVARYLSRAFLIPLRSGADGSTNNLGLAVRSDTPPVGAYRPKKLGKNLWLLYGPSVSQILYSARTQDGVAEQIRPELEDKLEAEFVRLMNADIQ